MTLIDLWRTTSFRLALQFLLLFCIASIGLFTFVHLETRDFLREKNDEWIRREMAGLQRMQPDQIRTRLQYLAGEASAFERPFMLLDTNAAVLAGPPISVSTKVLQDATPENFEGRAYGKERHYRGMSAALADGSFAVVAMELDEEREFDARLFNATVAGAAGTAVLGLLGAALLGFGAMRRIDGITRAIERIIRGDLSQRLPTGRAGGDIDRLTGVVNTMLDEIERLLHEVKGVCDNIAHDMRTPLTRLLAGLERSRRRASSVADYQGHVDEAIEEVHGMLRTFSALLRISEVEDGVRRAGFIDIDLAAIAQDAVELFEPAAEERGILLEYNGSQQHSTALSGDPDLIFEAVSNLIDNALKFSGDHGRVVVTVAGGPDELFIDVEDTGPGIELAEIDAVLRRFHRTEPSRTTPGNGLGLSLVAAIARIHDLDLTLSNTGTGLSARMTRRLKY